MGRILGFVGVLISAGLVFYLYTKQAQSFANIGGGTTIQAAENMTGVRGDLLGIANAERGYQASQGKYASLDELISGNYISIKSERPPYIYEVETASSSFRATATRTMKGAPAQLWITETMQVQASD